MAFLGIRTFNVYAMYNAGRVGAVALLGILTFHVYAVYVAGRVGAGC